MKKLPVDHGTPRKLQSPVRRKAAAVDLSQRAEVTLVVRSRGSEDAWRKLVAEATGGMPKERRYLTHKEFARDWGSSPEDIEAVRTFARKQRLKVVSSDAFRRCVVVSGTLAQLERVFSVEFHAVSHPLGTFHSHRGTPHVDASVQPLIEFVLGLDNLPSAGPHAAVAPRANITDWRAVLEAYSIPRRLRGKGQCVAVIELGGGFHKRDLAAYFKLLGVSMPRIIVRGGNKPAPVKAIREFLGLLTGGTFNGPARLADWVQWTIETTMDLTVVGTIAPEASILVVQTPNNDPGQYHAVTGVIADVKNVPSVLSCSWSGNEASQTPALMQALDWWFQAAAVLGIAVCCSSGDAGDGTLAETKPPYTFATNFPATDPYVLACGGTTLHPERGTEVTWRQTRTGVQMASGGGFSEVFPLPSWQRAAGIKASEWVPRGSTSGKGRGIPDVAAKANLENAYAIIVGGMETAAGGTSAAAPLWAGVSAILTQGLRARLGSLHEPLYAGSLRRGLRDITRGNNGQLQAGRGWDPCTGWGSPRVEKLLELLRRGSS